MSTWFIVAQIFGVVVICFEFASYQIKDKRKYLLVNGIGSGIWALMFVAMGLATSMSTLFSLVVVAVYSSTRALVFWWIFKKDSKKRRLAGKIFLGFMIVVALSAGIFVITGIEYREVRILQSVALVFALGFVIGQYLPGKHPVRITVFFYAIMLFLTQTPLNIVEGNGIERWNIMGMLIEASKMASVVVFYVLLVRKSHLAKKLKIIKEQVACEMNKIDLCSNIEQIAAIIPVEKIEKLAAKMVRLELSLIDKSELTDARTIEQKTQAVTDDLNTVHDIKILLEKIMKLKLQKLDGRRKALQEAMADVIKPNASSVI
ncbi:MAG: YgjV family protein [Firmicutes bacterium]|nr:YgjV family protein [Bacillota bacterium]